MHTWEDKPYWLIADDIAYTAYRQLFSQIKIRNTNYFSDNIPLSIDYENDITGTSMCIEYIHNIVTEDSLTVPDNIACCLAADDYAEIEIVTLLPKHYRIKTLKKNKQFSFDFLNVIRHEIEHVFQDGAFKAKENNLVTFDRSDSNFLLKPEEVSAYVHGFRISTSSRAHFLTSVRKFIETHGNNLNLKKSEIENTIKIWYDYLVNLKHTRGDKNE